MTTPTPNAIQGTVATAPPNSYWTLNRILAAIVITGYAFLFVDVRFEHRDILSENWQGWIPILYAATAVIIGGLTLAFWTRGGQIVFAGLSLIAFVVGFLGVWYHTDGHLLKILPIVLATNTTPSTTSVPTEKTEENGREEGEESSQTTPPRTSVADSASVPLTENTSPGRGETEKGPPLLAPFGFAGMGLLGLLAASRRFRAES